MSQATYNPPRDCGLEIVYCDESLLVVNKPAGLLSVPGRGTDKMDSLATRVQNEFPDARSVHRLDMSTSGLLVFARGADMQRRLSKMFRDHEVEKRYVAVVAGKVEPANIQGPLSPAPLQRGMERLFLLPPKRESEAGELREGGWGEVNLPIVADWPNRPLRKIDAELGKPSLTRYLVLSHDDDSTRVELEPVTGRTHQLRLHMAAIGHPILGDALYGGRAAERLMLHACSLCFIHPANGTLLNLQSAPPF